MPENLTANDYSPNVIVFKLKEEFRSTASENMINNSSLISALDYLGAGNVEKKFKGEQKPAAEKNSWGAEYADLSLIYQTKYSKNITMEDAVNQVYASGTVEYAYPHYIQKVCFTPNDPFYTSNTGQYFINKVQCPAGWDIQQGDTNVVVGIVDSGTDWDHPDLAANVKMNYADPIDGIDNDGDGYIDNFRGWDLGGADYANVVGDNDPMIMGSNNNHGSHVSGDACAVTNNGIGVSSPGFKCKFLPVKCAADNDTRGPGGEGYIIAGYEGIQYAADHGANIINCSWGGTGGSQFEQDVITYATINKNAVVVCAAGNDGLNETFFPAGYKYVIGVGATTSTDAKASFSNYGPVVDVCAPGNNTYSTLWNNSYATFSGTSMASPIACGVAAIIKSQFPAYNGLQVGEKLRMTCDNIDALNPSYAGLLGRGRVNMLRALTISSPSVRISSTNVTDGNNNVPQPNDTLRIRGTFTNYLDPTINCAAVLTTTSTAVTILNGNATLGAIGTLGNANNNVNPFLVKVNSNAPSNTIATFKVTFTDGSYSDYDLFTVVVNPAYFDMNINNVATTINGTGLIGYNNFSTNTQGIGFKYKGGATLTFEGGIIAGYSTAKMVNNLRGAANNGAVQDADFVNVVPFQITQPGVISNQDGNCEFTDANGGASINGLNIKEAAYEWNDAANDDYIIMKYRVKNTTAAPITNFYLGIYEDWDIGINGASNRANYDAVNKIGYVFRTDNIPVTYTGISLLSIGTPTWWAIDNDNTLAGNPWGVYDGFTDAEKFQSISSGIGRQQAGVAGTGSDVSCSYGSGPYTILPGQEIVVAYALVAADNLTDLQTNANNAKLKYATISGISSFDPLLPSKYNLSQNYPNPFNPTTSISYSLIKNGFASLKVYDMLGKEVSTLVNGIQNAGTYTYSFDASKLSSGVYYYKLESAEFTDTKRMMLVK
ncbi:hypothetical protein BH10BAC5_BH10BAC5_01050 [soil metagenome]